MPGAAGTVRYVRLIGVGTSLVLLIVLTALAYRIAYTAPAAPIYERTTLVLAAAGLAIAGCSLIGFLWYAGNDGTPREHRTRPEVGPIVVVGDGQGHVAIRIDGHAVTLDVGDGLSAGGRPRPHGQ